MANSDPPQVLQLVISRCNQVLEHVSNVRRIVNCQTHTDQHVNPHQTQGRFGNPGDEEGAVNTQIFGRIWNNHAHPDHPETQQTQPSASFAKARGNTTDGYLPEVHVAQSVDDG